MKTELAKNLSDHHRRFQETLFKAIEDFEQETGLIVTKIRILRAEESGKSRELSGIAAKVKL